MITKPHEYRHSCTIHHDVHYEISGNSKGPYAGTGTLHVGRVVWTREAMPIETSQPCVSAYVEGIGVISIDAHSLHQVSS
jgi:hypothetical protein